MSKPRDIELFLSAYAGQRSNPSSKNNYLFYKNEIPCQPDGLRYEEWMKAYEKDFIELEMNHGYIQWFFPIRERGVNPLSQPLEPYEIEQMKDDPIISERLLRSYKMMLLFYGIELKDDRLSLSSNYKERLRNLQDHSHNLLRITRIIKHLSEFPKLQSHAANLVLFFVAIHSEGLLNFQQGSMRGNSLDQWWSNCFRNQEERQNIRNIVMNRGEFGEKIWGFKEYGKWFDDRNAKT
ncbi:uncharacterized protein I206_100776 [Kwoniella pini CBS 10737]|uniref:Opioid growth factor receptor (OGFr) conserved domain-containing protein n=1 Tax=Kwoniella pini CBS 10737 TaxID=1296096 RepID=A0A1B9ID65_9TREE|nr:uncharacterized protein I206_00551 [Kwoniella pini CBS 10737]OCF53250.1 hypothetical protein I206_00551 [Kwoniella pini CBS 10737]